MEHLLSFTELEQTITYNLERLQDARVRKEDELSGIFESRMNRALDDYGHLIIQAGKVALNEHASTTV